MTKLKTLITPHDHVQGNKDAPLTLLEYGDFECPHCGHAYPIVKALFQWALVELKEGWRTWFQKSETASAPSPAPLPAKVADEVRAMTPLSR